MEDSEVEEYLSKSDILVYRVYTKLIKKLNKEAISDYEKNKGAIIGKMPASLLFNLAEAYFREGLYQKSIKMFDEFVTKYSFNTASSLARLRIALAYDLLDKDQKKIIGHT